MTSFTESILDAVLDDEFKELVFNWLLRCSPHEKGIGIHEFQNSTTVPDFSQVVFESIKSFALSKLAVIIFCIYFIGPCTDGFEELFFN